MIRRKITRFATVALTILTAYLVSEYLLIFMEDYKDGRSYKSVIISMLIIVAIYYPALTLLEKYIKKLSAEYVKTSKNFAKSNTVGLFIGFFIAFFILFSLFAYVWYDLNVLNDLSKGIQRLF